MKRFQFRTIVWLGLALLLRTSLAFDLVSAILSQAPSLPGRLPTSLQELKSMLSPEVLEKMLRSKLPSLDNLRGDPVQIQKVLAKLKPMQGRFDPQILQLLSSSFPSSSESEPASHATFPPGYTFPGSAGDSVADHSVKRGIPVDPTQRFSYPRRNGPGYNNRNERRPTPSPKFSSRFRNQQHDSEETTLVMTASSLFNPSTDFTEAPPPPIAANIDHITDPNIRNHRLYGWRTQNFTMIDREEDLMMDEAAIVPSMIPLASASDEIQATTPVSVGNFSNEADEDVSRDPEDIFPFTPRPREPLRQSSSENEPIATHSSVNTATYFRPSPPDGSNFYGPGHEFYSSTSRGPDVELPMPKRPPKNRKRFRPGYAQVPGPMQGTHVKQDRILAPQSPAQGHHIPLIGQFGQVMGSQRIMHNNGGHGTFGGHNTHPFAHYVEREEMYSPSIYHHNKFHYHNPTIEKDKIDGEAQATDKLDSGWTSTFVLLGGLVAASALVAFILPSFLTTMTTVGKDNDQAADSPTDVWTDIKGLYSDLSHIAKGDFSHFNRDEEETKSSTSRVTPDISQDSEADRSDQVSEQSEDQEHYTTPQINSRGRGRGRHNDTLASPVHPSISLNNETFLGGNRYRKANSTFLKEWAKVQLQLIDQN